MVYNPFIAGTVFIRQNLTSVDVRFWRIKTNVRYKEFFFSDGCRPINNTGIQIKREELTKPFKMISNRSKLFGLQDLYKIISALQGLIHFHGNSTQWPSLICRCCQGYMTSQGHYMGILLTCYPLHHIYMGGSALRHSKEQAVLIGTETSQWILSVWCGTLCHTHTLSDSLNSPFLT